ncbi:MAG: hypothetical protein ABI548_01655 [Polyangiaceae bacterium]
MPKPHFSEASKAEQTKFDIARQSTAIACAAGGFVYAVAAGQYNALDLIYRCGYCARPEDVQQPVHAQLAKMHAAGEAPAAIADFRRAMSLELDFERRCAHKVTSMARWATEPSQKERDSILAAERRQEERKRAVELRAVELVAADRRKKTADSIEKARLRAEKEIGT